MANTFHIRIKKEYAAAVIEDLQKMDAVELISESEFQIPDWQIELGRKEVQNILDGNTELKSWEETKKILKA